MLDLLYLLLRLRMLAASPSTQYHDPLLVAGIGAAGAGAGAAAGGAGAGTALLYRVHNTACVVPHVLYRGGYATCVGRVWCATVVVQRACVWCRVWCARMVV